MARGPGTHRGSRSRGGKGSGGGPGGAFARGRGRLRGPPGGTWSGAPFLLAVEGHVATHTALTGLVVVPCGEGRSCNIIILFTHTFSDWCSGALILGEKFFKALKHKVEV